jgi:competence ComEA-like helix-hairpin-helix protein
MVEAVRDSAEEEMNGTRMQPMRPIRAEIKFGSICLSRLICLLFCLSFVDTQAQERININTASAEELTRLPYVGQTVAQRILTYRRKHGNFKRPQDLIIIKGLSAKRYRQIAHLIRI